MRSLLLALRAFHGNARGTVVVIFALSLVPLLVGIGGAIDLARAYNTQTEMQADLDSALIASVKKVATSGTSDLKTLLKSWFSAQTTLSDYTYDSITISTTAGSISATMSATIDTTFLQLIGLDTLTVAVISTAVGPASTYINVYIVLDNSASMMLAATAADQKLMYAAASCVFACHSGSSVTVNKTKYSNYYLYARAAGITLRTDVELEAAKAVVTAITTADPNAAYIRAGVYKIGATATTILSPTFTMSSVTSALTTSAAEDYSYFNKSLPALTTIVGASGDGSSKTSPKKLVLLVTDGVQSSLSWVQTLARRPYISPINPDWCDTMKDTNDVTVGVLYTEYIASSYIQSDEHYSTSLAKTMASSYWSSYWSGTYDSDLTATETRQAALPTALEKCATSSDYFLSASSVSGIESGLASLFETYMQTVRLSE